MIFLSLTMINEQTKLWSKENHEISGGIPLTFIMVVSLSSNSPLSYGPYQEAEEPAAQ